MTFGDILKAKMDEKGLIVTRVSEMTGISRTAINNYIEKGTEPTVPMLIKLASCLKIDPVELYPGLTNTVKSSDSDTALIPLLRQQINSLRIISKEKENLISALQGENEYLLAKLGVSHAAS